MKTFTSSEIPKNIYLVRHGKIDYNKRFEDGGYVEVHGQLSAEGVAQITKTANEIAQSLDNTDVTVITSPKRRCFQSTDIIISTLEEIYSVNIDVNKGFRDVDILTRSENRPLGSYAVWESGLKDGETWYDGWLRCNKFFPEEENPKSLYKRVCDAFKKLSITLPTIIVCHEEVMLALATHLEIDCDRPSYAETWLVKAV